MKPIDPPALLGTPLLLIKVLSRVEQTGTCWLWEGHTNQKGYGQIDLKDDRGRYHKYAVHRLVYMAMRGDIPPDLQIDHLCRVRNCVNPQHLEVVTARENLMRGNTIPARNARKTHCPRGHPYSAENTYRFPSNPGRFCKICFKASSARWHREHPHGKGTTG